MRELLKYSLLKKYILILLILIILFIFSGCFATSMEHNARIINSTKYSLYTYNDKMNDIFEDNNLSGGYSFSFLNSNKINDLWQYSLQYTLPELGFGFNIKRLLINYDFLFFSINYFIGIYPINLTNEIISLLTINVFNHDVNFICGLGNTMKFYNWLNTGTKLESSLFNFDHYMKYNYLLISLSFDFLTFGKGKKIFISANVEDTISYFINLNYRWLLENSNFFENEKIILLLLGVYIY